MSDKKYTDEEIIKALELCSKSLSIKTCQKCPFYLQTNCVSALKSYAIDLINRQKAENLELKLKVNELLAYKQEVTKNNIKNYETYKSQKAEIEKLDIELKAMRGAANSYKAEVERLKADNKIYIEANKVIGHQRDQRDKEIDELQKQIDGLDVRENKIKAEAYKEFAERLKNEKIAPPFSINCTINMIDNLLKEMVGEEE